MSRRLRIARIGTVSLILALLAFLPAGTLARAPEVCLFNRILGRECFGCGMTRALSSLLDGDLYQALSYNRLSVVVLVLAIALLFWDVLRLLLPAGSVNVEQLKTAAGIAWAVVSVVVLLILAAPFVLPEETILRLAPACDWKTKYGRECPLCGMTQAFVAISRGNFDAAVAANRASVVVYAFFATNELLLAGWLLAGLGFRRRSWTIARPEN